MRRDTEIDGPVGARRISIVYSLLNPEPGILLQDWVVGFETVLSNLEDSEDGMWRSPATSKVGLVASCVWLKTLSVGSAFGGSGRAAALTSHFQLGYQAGRCRGGATVPSTPVGFRRAFLAWRAQIHDFVTRRHVQSSKYLINSLLMLNSPSLQVFAQPSQFEF